MWTLRPGDSLSTVRERVKRFAKGEVSCTPSIRPNVVCSARSEGMPLTGVAGRLSFLADSAGRIGLVQFRRGDPYLPTAVRDRVEAEWKQEVASLRASFDSVRKATTSTERQENVRSQRWLSSDSAWSATVLYVGETDTVLAVTLADERMLRDLRAASPYADMVLGSTLVFPAMTKSIEAFYTAMLTARSAAATASMLAPAPRVELAECDLELADIVVPADPNDSYSGDARRMYGPEVASTLELAVPIAYPEWRIEFGRHAYLVSPSGTAEQVQILSDRDYESFGVYAGDDIYAFAIKRVRRADSAERRLTEFRTAELCSSRTDILFVRRTKTGEVAEAVLVPLDEEAMVTNVRQIDFTSGLDSRASLGVEYSAIYGGEGWLGEIDWLSIIHTDPPRVAERALIRLGKIARDASDSTAGAVVNTRIVGDTLSFHTLEGSESHLMTQYVTVGLDSGRVLRAAALFKRLR